MTILSRSNSIDTHDPYDYFENFGYLELLIFPIVANILLKIVCNGYGSRNPIEYDLINYRYFIWYYSFPPILVWKIHTLYVKMGNTWNYCIISTFYMIVLLLSFFIIVFVKPDRYIYKYIISSRENYKYNQLFLSQLPPKSVYQKHFRYSNIISNCRICLEPFYAISSSSSSSSSSYNTEAILACGHRFHSPCIRQWELIQFTKNPYTHHYQCPLCKQNYNWNTKYHYISH